METLSSEEFRQKYQITSGHRVIPKRGSKFNFSTNPNKPDNKNKTEEKYEIEVLMPLKESGIIRNYYFNKFKFRISKRCWYTIDYLVLLPNDMIKAIDVKGFPTDDAIVKIKSASELCPDMIWAFAYFDKKDQEWKEKVF